MEDKTTWAGSPLFSSPVDPGVIDEQEKKATPQDLFRTYWEYQWNRAKPEIIAKSQQAEELISPLQFMDAIYRPDMKTEIVLVAPNENCAQAVDCQYRSLITDILKKVSDDSVFVTYYVFAPL